MNIALCHFRVEETDGVSLEMEKWKQVIKDAGHQLYYIAGNKPNNDVLVIRQLEYETKVNDKINHNAYISCDNYVDDTSFRKDIESVANEIELQLIKYIDDYQLEMLIINNIWSLGWNLPAAIGFYKAVKKKDIQCFCHHHDFYWERDLYSNPQSICVKEMLEQYFPPKDNFIKHVVINSIAQKSIKNRKNIDAKIIPNVFDFNENWIEDDFNKNFKQAIGLKEGDIFILQATRIVRRKAIELTIDSIAKLQEPQHIKLLYETPLYDQSKFTKNNGIYLVLTGAVEDRGYCEKLIEYAKSKQVRLIFAEHLVAYERSFSKKKKIYSFWDTYVFADLVTYPSIAEGWGNQFLEAIVAKKPILVYKYPVYKTDIEPFGFNIAELGDSHTRENGLVKVEENILNDVAKQLISHLIDKDKRTEIVEKNFGIGKKHLSLQALKEKLKEAQILETND